jgi:hypothetical protein
LPEQVHIRDHRIDLLRGIALVMIFINHIPGTIWENVTSRNFGFSDAAEGFVLMSGIATGLAYGVPFLRGRPTWPEALRPWRRALTLWLVHLLVVGFIVALFVMASDHGAILEMAEKRNILPVLSDPAGYLSALILLGHQFAYADILPLYIVLMLFAPVILFLAVRWPYAVIAGSLLLWFLVGLAKVKMPTYPLDYGWFFNPLAWQVLFVAGIVTGLFLRQGRRLLPVRTWALWLATGFLILSAVWVQIPAVAAWGGHGLWLLYEYAGFPSVVTSFDKSFLYLPRLLHILALAYVLSVLPAVRRLAALPALAPLVMLGRHSLPVFATSTVLAYAAQVIKAVHGPSVILDTALIVMGLAVLFALAKAYDTRKQRHRPLAASPAT